ncbi:MAG TPA: TatD family hydrolase [Rhodothermales bacterium]|nr:TatD family hydrolase [Rhodothermales bacterium]
MLIDTHAHLYHDRFGSDRDDVITRAREAGVEIIVMPAIDIPSIKAALELCDRHAGLYAMAAIHPSDTKEATQADFDQVVRFCEHPKVVAVGESGLDYYWDRSFDEKQQTFFRMHIRLAAATELPLVIHNREASEDVVRILKEERTSLPQPERLRGIFHCFGGPVEIAHEAASLNFLLGIGGTLTFKNSGVADIVREIPMDQIVLETDAPFLAPVPHRGKRNEPAYTRLVAEKLAEVKGMSIVEVEHVTTANAERVFNLQHAN